jgi:Na+-driven multidrug efflux pump
MTVTLVALGGIELPLGYFFSQVAGLGAIGIAWGSAIAGLSRPLLQLPYFLSNRWMRARVFDDSHRPPAPTHPGDSAAQAEPAAGGGS